MAAVIKGADELRKTLRTLAPKVLPDLGAPLVRASLAVVTRAAGLVPEDTGDLADSAFIDGPDFNKSALSATTSAGFDSKHAPYAEIGVHDKAHVEPPKFLSRATDGIEEELAEDIGDALMASIERNAR